MPTPSIEYILQLGIRLDGSQNLIWAPLTEPLLHSDSLIVPRPRSYRRAFNEFDEQPPGAGAAHKFMSEVIAAAGLGNGAPRRVLLGLTSLMQPPRYFCPAGDWFYGFGDRVADLRVLFDPCPIVLMISPQNPATFLSNAWASGLYPGFEDVPPDPFDLKWHTVVEDIRQKNPDTKILICPVETGPITWPLALQTLSDISGDETKALQRALARYHLSEKGNQQMTAYLDENGPMPLRLHSRVVFSFLKAYRTDAKGVSDCAIPGWTTEQNDAMEQHYNADLRALKAGYKGDFWGMSA